MTDKEAQVFVAGVARNEDGVHESDPDAFTDN
jgi:hypothetical protein